MAYVSTKTQKYDELSLQNLVNFAKDGDTSNIALPFNFTLYGKTFHVNISYTKGYFDLSKGMNIDRGYYLNVDSGYVNGLDSDSTTGLGTLGHSWLLKRVTRYTKKQDGLARENWGYPFVQIVRQLKKDILDRRIKSGCQIERKLTRLGYPSVAETSQIISELIVVKYTTRYSKAVAQVLDIINTKNLTTAEAVEADHKVRDYIRTDVKKLKRMLKNVENEE